MARQAPVLPATDEGFVKKVKPLFRLSERETASYAFLRGIDYQVEECPLVAGNTQLRYKGLLDRLERESPGAKASFYHGFLERGKPDLAEVERPELRPCISCGMPTPAEICSYCRMVDSHTEEGHVTFAAGDLVLLVDRKGRRYLVTLESGREFHSHLGLVGHDEIIGGQEGDELDTSLGRKYRAFRPTLADFILKMPRGAQVIYPKDIGPILVEADIFPGARILEAGTGSGALTLALLRAVGPKGTVHTLRCP